MGIFKRRYKAPQLSSSDELDSLLEKGQPILMDFWKSNCQPCRVMDGIVDVIRKANPDIIYMDEPFGALDSLTRLTMRSELIRIWKAARPTILFVTHDVEESVMLADRVVVLSPRPGRIAEEVANDLPHPRDPSDPAFAAIRSRLFRALGVDARA